jgi:hypothetical protein
MKADAPKPEPAEKEFDQAQEEAFSNEGAPPPTEARSKATAVVRPCSLLSARLPSRGC